MLKKPLCRIVFLLPFLSVCVYFFLIFGLRISGKRELAQAESLFRRALAAGPDAGLRGDILNSLGFVLDLIRRVEGTLCRVALVRMDAGFPEEKLLAGLEANGTDYVARIKSNKVLDRMAAPHLARPPGRPPAAPRIWF